MTREELFDRYVADTLDDEGTAELGQLLAEDPSFAAAFAQDLLATGQFVQVGTELQRVEDSASVPPVGKEEPHPQLLTGSTPGASSFSLHPGRPSGGHVTPPPPPPPPSAAHPGSAFPPPSPPAMGRPIPRQVTARDGLFGEHHPQPVLHSAEQKSPVVAITLALLLLAGIGVAVYFGMNREEPEPDVTEGIIAQVDLAEGVVNVTRGIGQEKATRGMNLFEGSVLAVSEGSARIAYVNEKTYLHIRAGSEIRFEDHGAGKKIRLALGELTVEAGPQPVGQAMVVTTDYAITTLLGTKVTVRAQAKNTIVEVSEGRVQVERPSGGERVEVPAGAWTAVGVDGPLFAWEFVAAVNFNGESEDVEGNRWLSQAEATASGMVVTGLERPADNRQSVETPKGYVPDPGVRNVLMTSVAGKSDRLTIKWPQPNGQYQIFVWIMEDEGDQVRSLRLNVEEVLVDQELGKRQLLGDWNRFGPYPATVTDGSLDLLMSADAKFQSHDPHLSGLALFRQVGAAPAPAPGPQADPDDSAPPEEIEPPAE